MTSEKIRHLPQQWNVAGHEPIIDFLTQQLESGTVSHAYLFTGVTGLGKSTVAHHFATALLSTDRELADREYHQLERRNHQDLFWITRETNANGKKGKYIVIDQIRELLNQLHLKSFMGGYKVAIIEDADFLNMSAANSLLKTLEESPHKTVIILTASHEKLLPQTISSRCQIVRFGTVSSKTIETFLIKNRACDRKKAMRYAQLSYGRPGLAITFAEDPARYDQELQTAQQFLTVLTGETPEQFAYAAEMSLLGAEAVTEVVNIWRRVMRDVALVSVGLEHMTALAGIQGALQRVGEAWDMKRITRFAEGLDRTQRDLAGNINTKLCLENLFLNA